MYLEKYNLELRYGENSHENAQIFGKPSFEILHEGKQISFNNILDAEAAYVVAKHLKYIDGYGSVVVKHQTPCGASIKKNKIESIISAISADEESSFGGILSVNFKFDEECALAIKKKYLEVVIAEKFTENAIEILKSKKIRILKVNNYEPKVGKPAFGAYLIGERKLPNLKFEHVAGPKLSVEEMKELTFAYIVIEGVKSNAILISKNLTTVGIGTGQPSRKRAAWIATSLAEKEAEGAFAASDAFFPFPDGLEILANAKVKAVIAPMGSIRDEQIIESANRFGISFYKASGRVFRH
ncbi:phosphoribosylaminoimidazolecarboxamide formyltransferase [Thermosipho melanesiensis]|uniref:Phosphoribosylaminoimidazolecarboxamide formyltransferase n=2 Tax=Thermosipho melanesiensis TaxID=46541 RepID=A6LK05_THEM4|nr:phosphoribosylaminoimidazolecarboxamide formyltransferase [Thermosipho melanesiensis]ABR30256.1 Phosphoribosylaminoimidazolecarboxamide formyltransferase [Thermosipho melanesiensis BI429]APT73444.1 phosphoribosylaminoimidazolecarboxamide formyltransferase [Thermosipho melanesiensis]OOC37387.1 phosphoribosylaminoimidazolecarboxamide formyltransferase [Thermosipho melanesiensis]OOC39749.1 phosphoribosylaminoimidazolecarboxamide formyltransferase [Thermosipho melanesiensis]OOC39854.1 phosphori